MFLEIAVSYYNLYQPEEFLSSYHNSRHRGVEIAAAAIVAWQQGRRIR